MQSTVRHPAVAGGFYPKDRETLQSDLESYFPAQATPTPALGCVAPHAGYIYSGAVAGAVFANLDLPQRIIILCPNHTGKGRPLAIMSNGTWETPLGQAPIDLRTGGSPKEKIPPADRRRRCPSQRARHRGRIAVSPSPPSRFHLRAHRAGYGPVRHSGKAGRGHSRHRAGARRQNTDRRLERHEPLRERRRHSR